MVPILGYFYFGQDQRLADEASVLRATDNATDWLLCKGYANVLIEIANEVNVPRYDHAILTTPHCHRLIERVRERSGGGLLVSTSMGGGAVPPDTIIAASDFLLLHGNGVEEPDRVRAMVATCRQSPAYRDQPILFNEDDHFGFDQPDNNMVAAIESYAGWGLFDYRMEGESFDEGFQSVPTNWGISSERKRGFFRLLAEVTGSAP
jgi:hypothetical protein